VAEPVEFGRGVGWPLGVRRDADFGPRLAAVVGPVELAAEVAVVQGDVEGTVPPVGQEHGDVVADERGPGDGPPAGVRLDREQPLTGGDVRAGGGHGGSPEWCAGIL
jgi:hypothetical protein